MKKVFRILLSFLLAVSFLLCTGCVSVSDVISGIINGDSSSSSEIPVSSSSASSGPQSSSGEDSSSRSPQDPASSESTQVSSEASESSEISSETSEDSAGSESSQASSSSSEAPSSDPEPPKPLELSDVVGDMRDEIFRYTDENDNEFDNHFRIPEFLSDLAGAKEANDEIYDDYIEVFLDAEYAMENKMYYPCYFLDYEAYLNGDIVSVIIKSSYDGGNDYFSVYNLDLASGNLLDIHGLAKKFGVSYLTLRDRLVAAMEEDYNENWYYPDFLEDADEQKANTFTSENIDSSLFFIGENGQLMAVYTAYMSVGASYHHTVIAVP